MTLSAFRYHDAFPDQRVSSPLFRHLIEEWLHLNQLPSSRTALSRWGNREPVLADYERPADIVDAVDMAASTHKDAILLALLRLTRAGHQLAGRVVLQLMLPKLGRMALKTGGRTEQSWDSPGAEDRRHIAIAEFWAVMASYPLERRPHKVAANLALDTLHQMTARKRSHPVSESPVEPGELVEQAERHSRSDRLLFQTVGDVEDAGDELSPMADLDELLTWAISHDVISRHDAKLVAIVYLPDSAGAFGAVHAARRTGLTADAVRQRCSRARRRLITAVKTELSPEHTPCALTAYPR